MKHLEFPSKNGRQIQNMTTLQRGTQTYMNEWLTLCNACLAPSHSNASNRTELSWTSKTSFVSHRPMGNQRSLTKKYPKTFCFKSSFRVKLSKNRRESHTSKIGFSWAPSARHSVCHAQLSITFTRNVLCCALRPAALLYMHISRFASNLSFITLN